MKSEQEIKIKIEELKTVVLNSNPHDIGLQLEARNKIQILLWVLED